MTTPQPDRIAEIDIEELSKRFVAEQKNIMTDGYFEGAEIPIGQYIHANAFLKHFMEPLLSRIRELEQGQRLKEMEWTQTKIDCHELRIDKITVAYIRTNSSSPDSKARCSTAFSIIQNSSGWMVEKPNLDEAKAWCEQTVRAELLSLFTNQTKQ